MSFECGQRSENVLLSVAHVHMTPFSLVLLLKSAKILVLAMVCAQVLRTSALHDCSQSIHVIFWSLDRFALFIRFFIIVIRFLSALVGYVSRKIAK